jgi:hypothetical protein
LAFHVVQDLRFIFRDSSAEKPALLIIWCVWSIFLIIGRGCWTCLEIILVFDYGCITLAIGLAMLGKLRCLVDLILNLSVFVNL